MLATFTLKLDGFITASNNCDYVFYRIFDPVSTVVSKRTMNLKFWILLTVFMKTAKKNICRCKCTLSCQKRFFHQSKLWAKQHIARSTPRRPLWQEAHLVPNILQPPNWQNVTTIRRQEIYDSVCSPTRTLERKNHKKKQARDFFDLRNCSAKQSVLKRMRQSGCVQCATPTNCVYCETKSSWRMLPTQYMQTFVKHTSDASTKEWVQHSILWNNYHANGAQLRKFATREPRCCETSVARLAARWRIAGHLGRTSPYPSQPLQNICQRIVRILLGIPLFNFGFGFCGILAPISLWLVRQLAQILNLKMNSKQLGLQSTTQ